MKHPHHLKRALVALLSVLTLSSASPASAEPWKFGVMGDTQWTAADPRGANPSTVPVSIIDQVNQEFIRQGVKFVIAVGDLSDDGREVSERTRAMAAQPLIDAGIGFFPFRGNHETSAMSRGYGSSGFRSNYPQTRTGTFTTTDGRQFRIGSNFSSPTGVSTELDGMSYSFDYGKGNSNARFVIIDPWAVATKAIKNPAGYTDGYTIHDQQEWISGRLNRSGRRSGGHAFVFSHQPLIAEGHQDTMFSGYANAHPDWQNEFFASMHSNGARYFICGHDHIHQRSIISSPDGKSRVEEIISASVSSKFYAPKPIGDPLWFGQKRRETSVSQEMDTVGFSIYTIDGPCVTVDYYSDDHGRWQSDGAFPEGSGLAGTGITPTFNFIKKESWGYCLNGKEFIVPQGGSYAGIRDRFRRSAARILDGTNNSVARDGTPGTAGAIGRRLSKAVETGWRAKSPTYGGGSALSSDILLLSGMTDPGKEQADLFTLSMTYDPAGVNPEKLRNGRFGLATKGADGSWINAVKRYARGDARFVAGPWKKGYPLGTYGVDALHRCVWAVIDFNGAFAAASFDK